ncbi:hypothetical protein O9Z70_06565 [Devosia sp. YIM 151766]|uniref:hypothetical protein n=1 Tax=Devosia sp. YIM 151766 TaxID=3017325 RepID=UPI00255CDDEA|nr:hypothetical protein [Devosia sp. YIM 151766]WIY54179.1 hypothetical protein O9Z70_06565 [Devosia sp. YIM 151766]
MVDFAAARRAIMDSQLATGAASLSQYFITPAGIGAGDSAPDLGAGQEPGCG